MSNCFKMGVIEGADKPQEVDDSMKHIRPSGKGNVEKGSNEMVKLERGVHWWGVLDHTQICAGGQRAHEWFCSDEPEFGCKVKATARPG
jgi:hypothetical protein